MSNLDSIFDRKNISNLTSYPQGGAIAFVVRWADEKVDCNRSQVWVAEGGSSCALTDELDAVSDPTWRSDGRQLAYLQVVDKVMQVHACNRDGTDPRCLSNFKFDVVAIEQWCRDRGKLLVLAYESKRDSMRPVVADYLPYKLDGSGFTAEDTISLFTVDERDGTIMRVPTSGGNVKEAKWESDGARIAYVAERLGTQRHRLDIWLTTGNSDENSTQVTTDYPTVSDLTWSPDSNALAFAASIEEGDSCVQAVAYDIVANAPMALPFIELASPSCIHWSRDGKALVALEAYRGRQRITALTIGEGVQPVLEEPWEITGFACTEEKLYAVGIGVNDGPRLWRAGHDGSEPVTVSAFNTHRIYQRNAQFRKFQVPDGESGNEVVDGWLLLPTGEGPYPLLVEMHGGPHSYVMLDPNVHDHWDPLLERGWSILALNSVGSSSYGREFAHRIIGRWGELDLSQHLAAIAELQSEGLASDEVVCFGHSYGGYLAAWALTQKGPWTAGVVSGAVVNLVSHTGTSDTGFYVGPYAMGGEPNEQWERYRALSPLTHVDKIRVPTLILQGENDQRCPAGQGEEFHAALIRAGKARSRLVIFPNSSHHLSSKGKPSLRRDYHERLINWVLYKDNAPPAPA